MVEATVQRLAYLRLEKRGGTRSDAQFYQQDVKPRKKLLVVTSCTPLEAMGVFETTLQAQIQKDKKKVKKKQWKEADWQNYLHRPLAKLLKPSRCYLCDGRSFFFLNGRAVDWLYRGAV